VSDTPAKSEGSPSSDTPESEGDKGAEIYVGGKLVGHGMEGMANALPEMLRDSDPQIEPAHVPNWETQPASDEMMDSEVLERAQKGVKRGQRESDGS
jgi:hypothetical protein